MNIMHTILAKTYVCIHHFWSCRKHEFHYQLCHSHSSQPAGLPLYKYHHHLGLWSILHAQVIQVGVSEY